MDASYQKKSDAGEEEKKESPSGGTTPTRGSPEEDNWPDLRRSLREMAIGLTVAFLYALYLGSRPAYEVAKAPKIAVLGSMGSGTRSLTRDLRRYGLEVAHERTDFDGAVSWLHVLLYAEDDLKRLVPKRRRSPLSDVGPVLGAWHVRNVAVDAVADDFFDECGVALFNGTCAATKEDAKDRSDQALKRWVGCAARGDCPKPFAATPVVVVRHPLRTIESMARHFCPSDGYTTLPQLRVAEAVLDRFVSKKSSGCVEDLAAYWRAYYSATLKLNATFMQRETTRACDVLRVLNNTTPRFRRASYFCKPSRFYSFRQLAIVLRELVRDYKAGALFSDDALSEIHPSLTWSTLSFTDPALVTDLQSMARHFGYDDHDVLTETDDDDDEVDLKKKPQE
mmetsp:Transcript_2851/g.8594  ORF Transcript_2851/g.8594 Transcript_2851/m.8594 type:complete len:395 (-) Transcript_2851:195-1379(-)